MQCSLFFCVVCLIADDFKTHISCFILIVKIHASLHYRPEHNPKKGGPVMSLKMSNFNLGLVQKQHPEKSFDDQMMSSLLINA